MKRISWLVVGGLVGLAWAAGDYHPCSEDKNGEPCASKQCDGNGNCVAATPTPKPTPRPETPTPKPETPTPASNRIVDGLFAWITIPAGVGVIGDATGTYSDEKPVWYARFSVFWMLETEVTQAQYDSKVKGHTRESTCMADDCPVVKVSWQQASDFCKAIGGRLPTEAEWEYAARAGTETKYWWGDSDSKIHTFANLADASAKKKYPDWSWSVAGSDGYADQAPVKKFPANPWGLYDMNGNVWEWVEDQYVADAYTRYAGHNSRNNPVDNPGAVVDSVDTSVNNSSFKRAVRGGSFDNRPEYLRSSDRGRGGPEYSVRFQGFRCVHGPARQH